MSIAAMHSIIALADEDVRTLAPGPRALLRSTWRRTPGGLAWFACSLLLAGAAHALNPDLRLTQYLHTSWRTEDGGSPAGMISITQTPDGFLWFSSYTQELHRFDGVRFVSRTVSVDGKVINPIVQVHADRAGGLWVLGMHQIVHLEGGVVVSHFELPGIMAFREIKEDADGSLWIVRGFANVTGQSLCHVSDRGAECFGESDGVPIREAFSLLADDDGSLWMGGQRALVHWRDGVSSVYPIETLKSNTGDIGVVALARGPDGTLWVGVQAGPGLGLGLLIDGTVEPFVTDGFDGRASAPPPSCAHDRGFSFPPPPGLLAHGLRDVAGLRRG
jgi:ligand-binding sensor domain-containing protein